MQRLLARWYMEIFDAHAVTPAMAILYVKRVCYETDTIRHTHVTITRNHHATSSGLGQSTSHIQNYSDRGTIRFAHSHLHKQLLESGIPVRI